MSTLFTFHSSWHDTTWLVEQLGFASSGDAILLIEDGVLALQSPITLASFLAKCRAQKILVFALADDVRLRGVESQYQDVKQIGYDEFVDLVTQHEKQVAW